ncbi:alkaline phosphatase [Gracilibacillus alcaliphilus]|uniref:alkaline phosphatase n=1 Tax=Gracilibacillus alcaliphilus TaxID=1401441 RepID=UPI001959351B|nr:alkaline phosphatase [Gracilibacillus alcaliphilus]MBM7676995.1 alkaline phosphatase [Gracilibacillus alcaliphilus]
MIKKLGVIALSASLFFSGVSTIAASADGNSQVNNIDDNGGKARNIIYMIPDGFNADYATNYRHFKGEDAAWDDHLKGMYTTYSADSNITDSAAAGTAMSTGVKTNNGMIGLDPEGNPQQTILEASQDKDMSTGLVATSTITHATPAAFGAHVDDRNKEPEIAQQLIDNEIDVLLGGGKNNFLPESEGGNQAEANVLQQAEEQGYQLIENRNQLLEADIDLDSEKLLGLFADEAMSPELHRNTDEEPSLAEMTQTAIDTLKKDEDGFFLMVEGSQIDWAGHDNDAAWAMTDVGAFEEAVQAAVDFAEEDGNTLVVIGGDHETGGMTVGANGSGTANPELLQSVTAIGANIAEELNEDRSNANEVVSKYTEMELSEEEIQSIQEAEDPKMAINTVISSKANVGWTSTNHTGVDIPVYAYGPGADQFSGSLDNTDLPKIIAEAAGIEFGGGAISKNQSEEQGQSKEMMYTVKSGDTLFEIGLQYNYLWTTLQEINQFPNPDLIYPGDEVYFK